MYNPVKDVNFKRGVCEGISPHDLTALLQDWCRGGETALDKLIPAVYAELHRLAHIYMVRERPGHTLQISVNQREALWSAVA